MFKRKKNNRELEAPPLASNAPDGIEVVRVWLGLGASHVAINPVTSTEMGKGNEGVLWGVILADIAKHASNALTQGQVTELSKSEVQAQMMKVFLDEMSKERNELGTISETN